MTDSVAQIRPIRPDDYKQVRFVIGKANMESLAVANRKVYTSPVTISVWVALSCVFVQSMKWWPNHEMHGVLAYLSPIPAFASVAVPILALTDWINRPYFENLTLDTLRRPDILDLASYYSRSSSSGFWILELGDVFVGLIAIDASVDSTSDELLKGGEKKSKGTSDTATIRHFFVEEPYRATGIQADLLAHAIKHAFAFPTVKRIRAPDSPLIPYIRSTLRRAGFQLDQNTGKVGVFGWKLGVRVLEKAEWVPTKTE